MSKVISINFKLGCPKNISDKLKKICGKIEPDNISANAPFVRQGENCAVAIMNPVDTVSVLDLNILLGTVLRDKNKQPWFTSDITFPEGSYAIFRNGTISSEFVADDVASRTMWYYMDGEMLLVSTSQRAIMLFLESFEFDERCIPWMLSTGSLGPEFSWDKRIKRIPPATAISLNRNKWSLEVLENKKEFKTRKRSFSEHKKILQNSIAKTFDNIQMDFNHWILPLSGGYDSRGILYFILDGIGDKKRKKPKTITWGLEQSQHIKGNDAYIAEKISRTLNLSHKYYHTDLSDEPKKDILNRFIFLGEGRIDQIGGYLDGFKIWKTLFEDGVQGIIRGDEGFGWADVSTPINVRYYNGFALCSDFSNLAELCHKYDIPIQEIPTHLKKKPEESLSTWRDRIYHDYRLPTVIAALSDLKLGYVEQSTPLLTNNILSVVRELPDGLRTEKKLFKKIVDSFEPKIDYANKGAIARAGHILNHPEVVKFLSQELLKEDAQTILPEGFLKTIIDNLKFESIKKPKQTNRSRLIALAKRFTPKFLKNVILSNTPLIVDYNVLAFRVYIILFMHRLLRNDFKD